MYLDEPYLDTPLARSLGIAPQSRGEATIALDELVARIERYEADGWQVVVHSQGDRSNREVVLAFGRAPVPPLAAPRRIEHCVLLPVSILPELAPLHVSEPTPAHPHTAASRLDHRPSAPVDPAEGA
jgi:predicted amidohydrolase YtcJ